MYVSNNNIVIRNAVSTDAVTLCRWWNDGAIMEHAGFPSGLGTSEEKIIEQLQTDSDERYRRLIVEIDHIAIGEMSFRNKGNGVVEIGIKICDRSSQNKGYGKKILSMLIEELFTNYQYETIVLDTNTKNIRAQRVYEQLGFNKIRVNYNSWTNQLGEMQSSIDYELKKTNFINFAKDTMEI